MNHAHDDDGIIDLRALASTPPPRGAFAMPSPFASEPPPAFSRDADESELHAAHPRRSKGKTVGIVIGTAAFLALSCVGIGFAFRGAKVVPRPAAAAAVVAPPAAPPVVVAPAPAPSPAVITASVSTDEPAAAEPPSTKKTKGGKSRAGAGKATTKLSAAPAKAASKAADPCNCHGDFQCNIRCAASK